MRDFLFNIQRIPKHRGRTRRSDLFVVKAFADPELVNWGSSAEIAYVAVLPTKAAARILCSRLNETYLMFMWEHEAEHKWGG